MKKGGQKGRVERQPLRRSHLAFMIFWLFGLCVLFAYGLALYLERTAPVSPVTGFHVSPAGAILFVVYPAAAGLQTILLLAGFWLLVMGMFGSRKWLLPGLAVFLLGLGFMAANYLISQ